MNDEAPKEPPLIMELDEFSGYVNCSSCTYDDSDLVVN